MTQQSMTTEVELKPCPFCGGEARFGVIKEGSMYSADDVNLGGEYIECSKCYTSTKLVFPLGQQAKPILILLWNQRHFESV
jgi:hypothetical protein